MRLLWICLLYFFLLNPESSAREPVKGFEFKISFVHPVRQHDNYNFSVDPTLGIFYYTPVSKRVLISGGLMAQAGKQNWDEYTAHTIYPEDWTPFPLRGMYNRRYKYLCAGVPLKLEQLFNGKFISSVYTEFTVGRYFQLDLNDYYNSKLVYSFDIDYHKLFYDAQLGITKDFYRIRKILLAAALSAGMRNQQLDGFINDYNITKYFYYSMTISARLRR